MFSDSNFLSVADALQKLHIANLRPIQEAPLRAILSGADIIASLPTGGGKSLLYQLPAVMDNRPLLTLVISPLRALQQDQVSTLTEKGIRAAALNSDLTLAQREAILSAMCEGGGLLYLAPEQLQNPMVAAALRQADIARVALDEAHILPQTKDDFRKAYGKIGTFVQTLPHRPQILALTATATHDDVRRIRKSLRMYEDTRIFHAPVRRENLRLLIKNIEPSKKGIPLETIRFRTVERMLDKWNCKGSVIVFCPTVKMVKQLHKWLKARDYAVSKFHGKMKPQKRKKSQDDFMCGKKPIMVATNAFGLGIDKPDIRMVIHAGLPLSLDGYIQEIGRAGRDGKKARCVLICAAGDFARNERLLKQSGKRKAVNRKLKRFYALKKLVKSNKCLWRGIERYFGEKYHKKCKKCCNCRKKRNA